MSAMVRSTKLAAKLASNLSLLPGFVWHGYVSANVAITVYRASPSVRRAAQPALRRATPIVRRITGPILVRVGGPGGASS